MGLFAPTSCSVEKHWKNFAACWKLVGKLFICCITGVLKTIALRVRDNSCLSFKYYARHAILAWFWPQNRACRKSTFSRLINLRTCERPFAMFFLVCVEVFWGYRCVLQRLFGHLNLHSAAPIEQRRFEHIVLTVTKRTKNVQKQHASSSNYVSSLLQHLVTVSHTVASFRSHMRDNNRFLRVVAHYMHNTCEERFWWSPKFQKSGKKFSDFYFILFLCL